ncbi:MAG: RecX family transcriptional regulator [Bacilli bacterium]|nr:RecX family transcriptional regulator [Bacilli bacterium]
MQSKNAGRTINDIYIGNKKIIIKLSDGSRLDILPFTYTNNYLFKGKELSDEDISLLKKDDEEGKLIDAANKILAKNNISVELMKEKLSWKCFDNEIVEKTIFYLKEHNLLNDYEYAKSLLNDLFAKNYGKNRIIDFLKNKKIDPEVISSITFDEDEEYNRALNIIDKLDLKFDNYNNTMKQVHIHDALVRYGYSFEVIKKMINNISYHQHDKEMEILRNEYPKTLKRYINKMTKDEAIDKTISYLLNKGFSYNDILIVKKEQQK